jgi:hypothetical protein
LLEESKFSRGILAEKDGKLSTPVIAFSELTGKLIMPS